MTLHSDGAGMVAKQDPFAACPENQFWCEEGGVDIVLLPQPHGVMLAVRMGSGHVEIRGGTVAWFRVQRLRDRLTVLLDERAAALAALDGDA